MLIKKIINLTEYINLFIKNKKINKFDFPGHHVNENIDVMNCQLLFFTRSIFFCLS